MSERDLVRNVVDFAFLIKGQLKSDQTALLRSILHMVIMEAEDLLEEFEGERPEPAHEDTRRERG